MKAERLQELREYYKQPGPGREFTELEKTNRELINALESERERSVKALKLVESMTPYLTSLPWHKTSQVYSQLRELGLTEMAKEVRF
jgi:hypothetical protein